MKTDYRLKGKHINDRKMTKLRIKNVANEKKTLLGTKEWNDKGYYAAHL